MNVLSPLRQRCFKKRNNSNFMKLVSAGLVIIQITFKGVYRDWLRN